MPHAPSRSLLARVPFFYGWVVVGVAFVTMAIGVNSRTAFSLLFPPVLDEFGWPRGITAGAFSTGFLASALYAPVIGMLMDRWGPRYVIALSAVLVSIGLASATLTSQPWHLHLTLGLLVVGGSVGMSYIGHGAFLPNWFRRRRGLAIGIAYAGVGVGSIVMFPWLQGVIAADGWRYACLVLAALVLAIVPLNLALQRRRPQDLGLLPDGAPSAAATAGATTTAQAPAAVEWTLRRAARTARFWWFAAACFCSMFAWYAVQVHQTRYLIDVGFAPGEAALALALVALFGIGGTIGTGYLSDRVGRRWAWTLANAGFVLCFVLLLRLQGQPDPVLMYGMVAAQGLLAYGISPLYSAIPADLFPGRSFGAIYGTLSLATSLGAAAGPWGAGALYDLTGSYVTAFWLCLVLALASIGCIWQVAPRKASAAGQ